MIWGIAKKPISYVADAERPSMYRSVIRDEPFEEDGLFIDPHFERLIIFVVIETNYCIGRSIRIAESRGRSPTIFSAA